MNTRLVSPKMCQLEEVVAAQRMTESGTGTLLFFKSCGHQTPLRPPPPQPPPLPVTSPSSSTWPPSQLPPPEAPGAPKPHVTPSSVGSWASQPLLLPPTGYQAVSARPDPIRGLRTKGPFI